jgi:PAS domain S-box-containing protein
MPRLSIAQRLALLAATVALVMTVAICLLSYFKGRAVLTDHELVDLGDEANLRMFEVREEFRYLMREVREGTAALPRPEDPRATAEQVHSPQFKAALQATFRRLLDHAEERGRQSQWNWVDRDIYLEAYCLREDADGSTHILRGLRRADGKPAEFDPEHESPLAGEALADLQARIRRLTEKQKPVTARQFMSDVKPVRGNAGRQALCVGFEFTAARGGPPVGLFVIAVDFTSMVGNEQRHSPRHLFFVADEAGRFLIHPDPGAVGTAVRDDRDRRGKTRFDFKTVPWAEAEPPGTDQAALGESLRTGELGEKLAYYFMRRPYDRGTPHRTPEQREALGRELEDLARRSPSFRFSRPRSQSREIAIASPDQDVLKEARQIVERHEKEVEAKGVGDWEGPVHCETFGAHAVLLRLGVDPAGPDESSGGTVHLIVAASLEEIAHDITIATRWVLWVSLMLCVGAGCLALFPAHLLTRPLQRINAAAQRIAKGEYDTDLPVESTSEIGVLSRTFRHMAGEIRERDEKLHDALARMQAVLRTAADGIITFNERGVIEEFNQAAERIFGYTAEEIKGEKVQKLMEIPAELARLAEEGTDKTVRSLKRVLSTPNVVRQGRRKDGSTFWLELAFSEVPVGDRRLTTGIFRDVTRRVEDEERIKQMNELLEARVRLRTAELQDAKAKLEEALQAAQAANRAKDVFVRTISHELRTPLSAVKGFTELLLNPKATKLRENPVPTLQKIRSASEYLLTLINDLLDVARYTAGEQIHLNVSEFDLSAFFQGLAEMTNPLVRKNNNSLATDSDGDLGKMRADETRVRQILLNLLSNAAKFTEGGTITFRSRRECGSGSDWIVFSVTDTGPGMTAEQIQNLFKPFYRADTSTTRRHGGTGLGLSISKLLAERMGGSIAVASEPGKGSTFTVRLPAVVPETDGIPAGPQRTPVPGAAPLRKNTVLVVDDDAMSREMLHSFLQRDGFQVLMANSGEDGIRLAREVRPAAITLDVMMPDMDGWAVLAALKSDRQTHDIPIVMLTVAEDRSRGYTLGASEYVTKPVDWNRLSDILKKYCDEPASILVVEDDPGQREHITQSLALAGWKVREAADGREALQQVEDQRPAIILLDLIMPNMDGFEFLDELRRRPGGDAIPVIVVTAKDLDDGERERLKGSVDNVLHKGAMSREELLARIRDEVRERVPQKEVAGG